MRPAGARAGGLSVCVLVAGAAACQFPSYQLDPSTDATGGDGQSSAGMGGAAGVPSAGQGPNGGTAGTGTAGAGLAGEPSAPKPTGITLQATTENALRESQTSGGTESTDLCPSPQVLIGVQGTTSDPVDVVRSVQGVCGETSVVEDGQTGKYLVKMTQTSLLPERGPVSSLHQVALCPADQLLIGFNGRAGGLVDGLEFRCASLAIVGSSPSFELVVRSEQNTATLGGLGGSAFSYAECSNERIAIGQFTRMAEAATAYGLICAAPGLIIE